MMLRQTTRYSNQMIYKFIILDEHILEYILTSYRDMTGFYCKIKE